MYIPSSSNRIKVIAISMIVAATTVVSTLSANAGITYYKSVGANGEVRYSQFRPKNTSDFEMITMRSDGRQDDSGELSGKTNNTAAAPKTAAEQQVEVLQERIKQQEQEKKTRQCQGLRNNLTQLNIGGQVYEMIDGKKVYLNESQINQKRETIKQALDQHCSGQPT